MKEMDIIEGLDFVIEKDENKVFVRGQLNYVRMAKDCKQEILALRAKIDAYEALAELKYCGSCSHFKEKVNEFGDYICCCIRSIYGMPFTKEDSCSYWEEKELE